MNKRIIFKKEFDNIYRQKVVKYFDKYFSDKKIDEAIFDAFKDGTIKLFRVYVEFCMICECLELVIDSEKIPDKGKKLVNKILLRTVEIKTYIESIITHIINIILVYKEKRCTLLAHLFSLLRYSRFLVLDFLCAQIVSPLYLAV